MSTLSRSKRLRCCCNSAFNRKVFASAVSLQIVICPNDFCLVRITPTFLLTYKRMFSYLWLYLCFFFCHHPLISSMYLSLSFLSVPSSFSQARSCQNARLLGRTSLLPPCSFPNFLSYSPQHETTPQHY